MSRGFWPGVVDEALLAGAVDLAHRQAAALQPAAVELAELGVAVAVGMLLQVLEVEQLQGDAGLAPLGVQVGAVGHGPVAAGRPRRGGRTAGPPGPRRSGASTWAQSSPAARARRTSCRPCPRRSRGSGPPPGGCAPGPTSVAGSRGSAAWTVARSPFLPFRMDGAFGPSSVATLRPPSPRRMPGRRGDHDDRSR